jgi:hypothetical protein
VEIRRTWLLVLTGIIAALLLLSACGDDDDSGADEEVEAGASLDAGEDDPSEEATDATDDGDGDSTQGEDDAGDDDSGSDGRTVDACSLLTAEELSEAMGVSMEAEEPQNFDPIFSCQWSGPALESVSLSVLYGGEDELNTYYEMSEDSEDVDDLGERAQWTAGILNFLEVQTDDYILDVSVNAPELEDEEAKKRAIQFAELAMDRVP